MMIGYWRMLCSIRIFGFQIENIIWLMQNITIQIIYFAFIAVSGIISKSRQLQEKTP